MIQFGGGGHSALEGRYNTIIGVMPDETKRSSAGIRRYGQRKIEEILVSEKKALSEVITYVASEGKAT